MTFLLLQIVNAMLAAASALIHLRFPTLWEDQAIVYSTMAGTLMACLTTVLLGAAMVFSDEIRKGHFIYLLLTLAFAGLQGYLLFLTGRDLGIIHLIKSRLGG